MFDELLRELRRMPKSFTVPIDLPLDEKGYLDRQCNHEDCSCCFKVVEQDWIEKVQDEAAYCPKCGCESPADEFNTPAQQKYIEKVGEKFVAEHLDQMMKRAVRRTRPKKIGGGLFNIEMSLSYKSDRIPTPIAQEASEALRQDFECPDCQCRYSVVGAGYFCPACKFNSAESDFDQTIETTMKAVELLNHIGEVVAEKADADVAHNLRQQMIEDQVENLITALQRVTESLYEKIPGAANAPFNVFQRMDDASTLWKNAVGKGYQDVLSANEYSFLKKMVQQRHKLGHSQGMVDQRYVQNSGDSKYKAGQRLVVSADAVRDLATIIVKLVDAFR